jgi:hypothetical protein
MFNIFALLAVERLEINVFGRGRRVRDAGAKDKLISLEGAKKT